MPDEIGSAVPVEVGRLNVVGPDRVDDGSRPAGSSQEAVQVDVGMGRDAEVPPADVRLGDHELGSGTAVEAGDGEAVDAEQRPLVEQHGRPGRVAGVPR